VPLTVPVAESAKPAGKDDPEASNQLYGATPPVAIKVCEYGAPLVASGNGDVVVMASTALMVIDRAAEAVCEPLSTTRTVKFEVPAVDGVPLIVPVEDRISGAGSAPCVMDHVYGVVPPEAENF
jgi:hypothetical protein